MCECPHPMQFNEDWESNPLSDYENFRREGGYSSTQAPVCWGCLVHGELGPSGTPDFPFQTDNALGPLLWGQKGCVGMETLQTVNFWPAQRQGCVPNTRKPPYFRTISLHCHCSPGISKMPTWWNLHCLIQETINLPEQGRWKQWSGRNNDKQKKLFGVRDHPLQKTEIKKKSTFWPWKL